MGLFLEGTPSCGFKRKPKAAPKQLFGSSLRKDEPPKWVNPRPRGLIDPWTSWAHVSYICQLGVGFGAQRSWLAPWKLNKQVYIYCIQSSWKLHGGFGHTFLLKKKQDGCWIAFTFQRLVLLRTRRSPHGRRRRSSKVSPGPEKAERRGETSN